MNMEPLNQKSLDRIVSQKALQIGSSFPCQICVLGFLVGVCLTSLFLAALTSLGTFELRGTSYSAISQGNSPLNSSSPGFINTVSNADCKFERNEVLTERWVDSKRSENGADDERVSLLHSAWNSLLSEPVDGGSALRHGAGLDRSAVPNAPHLENCKLNEQTNERLDKRHENERLPPWTTWKGLIDTHSASMANEQIEYFRDQAISEGAYPPWITGSDEENYPVTRKVQRDIWLHQHPENCRDPNVRFLVAEWERLPGFGIGAQLVGMCGLLSIAISEKRVLVTGYYNRADHDGCKGSYRSSWSCYFFPETSQECRDHAFELLGNKEALERGVITTKDSYKSKEIWNGRAPRLWGEPWSFLQPTTEINGSLVAFHRKIGSKMVESTGSAILDEISNSVYVWLDEYCPKCCFREGSREDGSHKSRKRMAKGF
ncbi:ALPHA- 16 -FUCOSYLTRANSFERASE [Salix koriyanagi]|uniref:ALPHA- 16 -FUCOSYLTRANSFERASE n=1 Tax=Salix koriyanagi TaxID=2511006 RepID=A0A9Q0W7K1_9ROSI|nr:ALPHA- 16 -FUCOSYLTRANSFERASE [Salix koriyanagi]KAJ6761599.1 ALPHA- 16 -FUCOSYLTRANSFERASE [Salix koriyanagi]